MRHPSSRPEFALLLLLAGLLVATPAPALGQDLTSCPPFEGITCQEFITDEAGVITDDEILEAEATRIEQTYGAQVAVVLVDSIGGWSIGRFAQELGNTWGVGSAERNDGIVVIVDVGGRETWVEYGDGLKDFPRDPSDIAARGNSAFAGGNFDLGVLNILSGLGEPASEISADSAGA